MSECPCYPPPLSRALEENYVSLNTFLISAAAFTLALAGSIPLLFRIGRHMEEEFW